ncbi:undecaprenyl-phosphate glucose phosphotransferase [Aurantimonas sp. MSK8Z-1]|uniref:undecaprenyl-phosphate glucose phosphotransferase n=1 Tax=Mangrovibrevibacter kandeliae TaxID=2968473 RepID=UPI0021179AEB|nr:undecaprenyl-phosphate glucose phosphotransferase [Aurantimonas sp. MSK8Z-1]MCW4114248.1 undecaprenyl-phosphate glucose phosphotransferase [Aurantimonas sp. MSK8Z-1]
MPDLEQLPVTRKTLETLPAPPLDPAEVELNPFARRTARQFRDKSISPRMLTGLLRMVEIALIAMSGFVGYLAYVGYGPGTLETYVTLILAGSVLCSLTLQVAQAYQFSTLRTLGQQGLRVAAGLAGTLAVIAVALFFMKAQHDVSRMWLGIWMASNAAVLFGARLLLRARLRSWRRNGILERRAVIVGGGASAESLIRSLEAQPESDIRVCGIFDDRGDRRSPPMVAGYHKLGTIRQLVEFARLAEIDMLIVTLPLSAEKRVLSLLKELWVLPLDIHLSAQSSQIRLLPRSYSYIGEVPLLDVFDRPLDEWDAVAKRAFDIVFASISLVLAAPLMLATAIAIKLDTRGPVIFRQKRHGFNNRIINVYKFRSLKHEQSDPSAAKIVTKGDNRVTRVGKFIRKSSIDELPQLVNVLRGELSLVGPRPHAVRAISSQNQTFVDIVDGYFGRHKVKPGITGWAQIKGWRGEIDEPEKLKHRFEHDLVYIENWSLLLDFYILVATPFSLLRSKNAY